LAEVGIEMEIVPLAAAQRSADHVAKKFEATFASPPLVGTDPDDILFSEFHSTSSIAVCSYASLDELLEKARQVYDRAERKALYAKIQATLVDDAPQIWLHNDILTTAMNQKVMGFTPNIDIYYLLLDWIWLKK
jgi:peptide/nickel transport system substrate-binding protein